jgi:putative ABC transport system permease protein
MAGRCCPRRRGTVAPAPRSTGRVCGRAAGRKWNVQPGDAVEVLLGESQRTLHVVGILPPRIAGRVVPSQLLVIDIQWLHDWLRASRTVDRLEIVVPPLPDRASHLLALGERLRSAGAGRWLVVAPADQAAANVAMTTAFRFNLAIVSLIALLVGLYLIVQGLDAAVTRRRGETAILRSLGYTPADVRRAWLLESLFYGLCAAAVGLVVGWLLSGFAVEAVARTVSTLYRQTRPPPVVPHLSDALWALTLGACGSLIAGWIPARDAAATPPAQMRSSAALSPRFRWLGSWRSGAVLLGLGALFTQLPPLRAASGTVYPLGGYAAAVCWLLGGTVLAVATIPLWSRLILRLMPDRPWRTVAAARLRATNSRHQLAVAGLLLASAMAAAMGFLVNSFEHTLERWMSYRFRADLYLSAPDFQGGSSPSVLQAETVAGLAAIPGVADADPMRLIPIQFRGFPAQLTASRHDTPWFRDEVLWLTPPRPVAGVPVFVNEAFAWRFGTQPGAVLDLESPSGPRSVTVAGVYADYGNEWGSIWVDWEWYRSAFLSDEASTVTLRVVPGGAGESVPQAVAAAYPHLALRSNAVLRQTALDIFRQTFALTRALQLIALVVAIAGLGLTIVSLLRDALGDLRTLRRLGLRAPQLAAATAVEALVLSCAGASGGWALSGLLGWLLIHVINRQTFGWTLIADVPLAGGLLQTVAICGCGLLVGAVGGGRLFASLASGRRLAALLAAGLLLSQAAPPAANAAASVSDGAVPALTADGFRVPQPHAPLSFPADHGNHPDYKIEWWYLTGHLATVADPLPQADVEAAFRDARWGFQATFFRFAVRPPSDAQSPLSDPAFDRDVFHLAHFALSDRSSASFNHHESLLREGWDAHAATGSLDVRHAAHSLRMTDAATNRMELRFGIGSDIRVELVLQPVSPLLRFGADGTSRKGDHPAARSFYLTWPRLATSGTLLHNGVRQAVAGLTWMDHEIASQQLDAGLVGWDWTAITLFDGSAVKAYRLRHADGTASRWSSCIVIAADGSLRELPASAFSWQEVDHWVSPHNGARYPTSVRITFPNPDGAPTSLLLIPAIADQEFGGGSAAAPYWEGSCRVFDSTGRQVGNAYLELVGFAGTPTGLR